MLFIPVQGLVYNIMSIQRKIAVDRRGSSNGDENPSTWHTVGTPLVLAYLMSDYDPVWNRELWTKWECISKSFRESVRCSRVICTDRLLVESSMRLRLTTWMKVLSIPNEIRPEEYSKHIMDGSYSSWSEISRDSRRTFAYILRKRPVLHLQLTRILHALASRFKDVGYCQGMNFVAGTILLAIACIREPGILSEGYVSATTSSTPPVSCTPPQTVIGSPPPPDNFIAVIQETEHTPNEILAFMICEKIFVRNHFVRMYELGLHTRLTIWTFDKLLESIFPSLHDLISERLQVSADFFASSWFITIFSADLDLYSSIRLMDLFISKGPKALHRFGLACLASQKSKLLEIGNRPDDEDPADGLKVLRNVAANAVAENGIESLILSSLTEFKFVNNRLIADLQTAGKVHGGAQLMFITNRDSKRRSWVIVPLATPPQDSQTLGKKKPVKSPRSAAFEAEWNKDAAAIRRQTTGGSNDEGSPSTSNNDKGVFKFLSKLKQRGGEHLPSSENRSNTAQGSPVSSPREYNDSAPLSGGRAILLSPDDGGGALKQKQRRRRKSGRKSESQESSFNAFKSFKKKLVAIIPGGNERNSSLKGYARTTEDTL